MWIDIASIVFICVTANHLGLVEAVTTALHIKRRRLPIISCPKCLTWWVTMNYGIINFTSYDESYDVVDFIHMLAVSFLASYIAIWLELLEGYIDTLYLKLYGKITSDNTDDTTAADPDEGYSAGSVP